MIKKTFFFAFFISQTIQSQVSKEHIVSNDNTFLIHKENEIPEFKNSIGDLTLRLDEAGNKQIKFGFTSQIWFRSIENNPGTLVNGLPQEQTFDASIRRLRLTMQTQLSPWYKIFLHFGINNQSFISGGGTGTGPLGYGKKPHIFFMDAYNEFTIVPETTESLNQRNNFSLYVGAGLHAFQGVSRITNATTSKILTGDLPLFNFTNIETSDQFARQLGVFIRGKWDKFDYRFSVNKPFANDLIPNVGQIVENNQTGKLSLNGYVSYQLLDKEPTTSPYYVGYYFGNKTILNIGTGFYSNKEATMSQPTLGEFKRHDQNIVAFDVFYDTPIGDKSKEMAFNFYSAFYKFNYGPMYNRNLGVMNPGTLDPNYIGQIAYEGAGNGEHLLGTGNIWYAQAAFILPKLKSFKIQPFATFSLKDMQSLNEKATYYDFGFNLYVFSQSARITYQYSSRPIFDKETRLIFDRKGDHLLMFQLTF